MLVCKCDICKRVLGEVNSGNTQKKFTEIYTVKIVKDYGVNKCIAQYELCEDCKNLIMRSIKDMSNIGQQHHYRKQQ